MSSHPHAPVELLHPTRNPLCTDLWAHYDDPHDRHRGKLPWSSDKGAMDIKPQGILVGDKFSGGMLTTFSRIGLPYVYVASTGCTWPTKRCLSLSICLVQDDSALGSEVDQREDVFHP
ncbi:hypothetical protein EMGR_004844 [Emarellia grisea]